MNVCSYIIIGLNLHTLLIRRIYGFIITYYYQKNGITECMVDKVHKQEPQCEWNATIIMGSRQRAHMQGLPDFKMAAQINVLAFSRRYHRRGANASVYTEQLKGLAPVYSINGNVQ